MRLFSTICLIHDTTSVVFFLVNCHLLFIYIVIVVAVVTLQVGYLIMCALSHHVLLFLILDIGMFNGHTCCRIYKKYLLFSEKRQTANLPNTAITTSAQTTLTTALRSQFSPFKEPLTINFNTKKCKMSYQPKK